MFDFPKQKQKGKQMLEKCYKHNILFFTMIKYVSYH